MNENQPQNYDNTDLDRLHAAARREHPEPNAGSVPLSMPVLMVAFVLTLLGGGYLGAYTHVSGFSFDKNSAFAGKPVDVRPISEGDKVQLDPFQTAMKKGSTTFNNCGGCHKPDGQGQPGSIPPLAGSEWVLGGTERLVRIAMNGVFGPVTVKGANFNTAGGMLPPPMTDVEIANVLTYIRNSWGNQAPMVTKEMVTRVRSEIKGHTGQWPSAELEAFKDKNCPGEIPAGPGATAAPAPAPGAAPVPPAK